MSATRCDDWMQTLSGRAYWVLDPRPHDVTIGDIAHALGMQCRFAGHVRRFYSVAEHSVLVSYCVEKCVAIDGLMHDATEAYVVDVPRPLKQNLSDYAEIEAKNWMAIADRFWLGRTLPPSVKAADNAVLLAEKAALLTESPMPWVGVPGAAAKVRIRGLGPRRARNLFLRRYRELTRQATLLDRALLVLDRWLMGVKK